jgi:ABC-type transport system involved in multi-copper enzyme maturation permease subunit
MMLFVFIILIPFIIACMHYFVFMRNMYTIAWKRIALGIITNLFGYGFFLYYLEREHIIKIGYGFFSYMLFLILGSVITTIIAIVTPGHSPTSPAPPSLPGQPHGEIKGK